MGQSFGHFPTLLLAFGPGAFALSFLRVLCADGEFESAVTGLHDGENCLRASRRSHLPARLGLVPERSIKNNDGSGRRDVGCLLRFESLLLWISAFSVGGSHEAARGAGRLYGPLAIVNVDWTGSGSRGSGDALSALGHSAIASRCFRLGCNVISHFACILTQDEASDLVTTIEWLFEGKSRNWKYKK